MKFFHLSDLHIGLKLYQRDLREDQEYILNQIVAIAQREQPDAIVIAGDIYDKAVPSAEAVEMFDHFISRLTSALPQTVIMAISGNHDSAPRIDCFRQVLSKQNLYMVGNPPQQENEYIEKVTLEDEYGKVNFYLFPFVKPGMVRNVVGVSEDGKNFSYDMTIRKMLEREEICPDERNVLVSHQFYVPIGKNPEDVERMESENYFVLGNIEHVYADVLDVFDYAALGHIHKPMRVGRENSRYCGTPLPYSVSEAGQEKAILMVELQEKVAGHEAALQIMPIPLTPLRQVQKIEGSLDEVLKQPSDDYVVVILTDKDNDDAIDWQSRTREAFPHLLEIQRKGMHMTDYGMETEVGQNVDPYELCYLFAPGLTQDEKDILEDVIHTVWEGNTL